MQQDWSLFNVHKEAMKHLGLLNKPVSIKFTLPPQTQEWHTDVPNGGVYPITFTTTGTVQTSSSTNDVLVNTINSPRTFRLYVNYDSEILSIMETIPREVIADFTYQIHPIQARIDSFNDYRYNGWVCFIASQCVPQQYYFPPFVG